MANLVDVQSMECDLLSESFDMTQRTTQTVVNLLSDIGSCISSLKIQYSVLGRTPVETNEVDNAGMSR